MAAQKTIDQPMSINQSAVIEDEILSRMKQKEFNEEQIIMGAELTSLE